MAYNAQNIGALRQRASQVARNPSAPGTAVRPGLRPMIPNEGNQVPGMGGGMRPITGPPTTSGPMGPPAWQQLAARGIAGQGSAAANRAMAAGLGPDKPPVPDVMSMDNVRPNFGGTPEMMPSFSGIGGAYATGLMGGAGTNPPVVATLMGGMSPGGPQVGMSPGPGGGQAGGPGGFGAGGLNPQILQMLQQRFAAMQPGGQFGPPQGAAGPQPTANPYFGGAPVNFGR